MKEFSIFEDENGEQLEVADKKARDEKLDANGGVADDVEINYILPKPSGGGVAPKKANLPTAISDCMAYAEELFGSLDVKDFLKKTDNVDNTKISSYANNITSESDFDEEDEDHPAEPNPILSKVFGYISNSFEIVRKKLYHINQTLGELEFGEVAGGKNLFDKTKYIKDYRVSSSDGTLTTYAGIGCSEHINIKGKTKLTITKCITSNDSGHLCAFYNASKTFISGVSANANSQRTIDVPSNAEYIVFNFSVSNIDLVMLEEGNTATDYETYIPSVKMLAEETANINSNLTCLNVLGYEVPEEVASWYIKQNGRQVTVYGVRVDLSKGYTVQGSNYRLRYNASVPARYTDSNTPIKGYCDGLEIVSGNIGWQYRESKSQIAFDDSTGFNVYMNPIDESKVKGKYLYYELAQPITYIIDGNEAITKINDSLSDYGMVNKFDGELLQGLYYTSNGKYANVGTYVCSKNKYSCKTGDDITLKLDKQFQYLYVLFYKTDGTYLGYETAENTKELNTKSVANADYFYFNIGGDIITPQTVGHVGVYVNNAIESIKADLTPKQIYNNTTGAFKTGGSIDIDLSNYNFIFVVLNTSASNPSSSRFVLTIPVITLSLSPYYCPASTVDARFEYSSGKLKFMSSTVEMYVVGIYASK